MSDYLRRTWRGEQGIAHTLWVWNVIVPAALIVLIYWTMSLLIAVLEWSDVPTLNPFAEEVHPVLYSSGYLCMVVLALCVLYGLVSLWQAAAHAVRWGITAKVVVAAFALGWAGYFARALASISN